MTKNKKLIITVLITMFLTSFLTFVVTYKLYDTIKSLRNSYAEKKELAFIHENFSDVKKLETLEEELMEKYSLIR